MNISRLLMILPLFLCVNALDCFADEMDTVYSFRSGVVKECLIDAQFGMYNLEQLMAEDFRSQVWDDVYGTTDGWAKGTHMNGQKWIAYYREGFNKILQTFDTYGYKFSLGTAYDVCIDTFRPIKDNFARNINHPQGCKDFVKQLNSRTSKDIESSSKIVCENVLNSNKALQNHTENVFNRGVYKTYYCGGTCKFMGDDMVYVIDADKNLVVFKEKVDDFCDGEYVVTTDIWYRTQGTKIQNRITDEYTINDLNSIAEKN